MTDISIAGCGMEIFRRVRDLLILTGGLWDSFEIDGGIRVEKQKSHYMYTNVRWRNSNSYESGVAGYGIVKAYIWTFTVYSKF